MREKPDGAKEPAALALRRIGRRRRSGAAVDRVCSRTAPARRGRPPPMRGADRPRGGVGDTQVARAPDDPLAAAAARRALEKLGAKDERPKR